MKIKTITTLELSSFCNLACKYCINRLLVKHKNRKPGIMTDAVFERCVEIVKQLSDQGTQKELNLNGNGESLLDPQLVKRIAAIRKKVDGKLHIQLSTNGVLLTPSLAADLKQAGINRLDLSMHSPMHARRARDAIIGAGLQGIPTIGPISGAHNWAGQLEPEHCTKYEPRGVRCDPLIEGRAYIQSEGDVVPCCYDYRNLGKIGHVFNDDILERELKPFALCERCHQIIPTQTAKNESKSMIASCAG